MKNIQNLSAKVPFQIGLAGWIIYIATPIIASLLPLSPAIYPQAKVLSWFPQALANTGLAAWKVGTILLALFTPCTTITIIGILTLRRNRNGLGSTSLLIGSALTLVFFPLLFEGPVVMTAAVLVGITSSRR